MRNEFGFKEGITKKEFLQWLCASKLATLYPKKLSGEITSKEYWDYYDNLIGQAQLLFDLDDLDLFDIKKL